MNYFKCINLQGNSLNNIIISCSSNLAGKTIYCQKTGYSGSKVCPSTSPYFVEFNLPDGTYTISATYLGTTYSDTLEVPAQTNLKLIPTGATATPVDDIQKWLECAEISKPYTTISEVLSDVITLYKLISSNNASDYLARSTSWASSICGDSLAMIFIGSNDYCASKLISNSTWLTAICNSSYYAKVLTTVVPKMTSLTTPSGQVGYTSCDSRSTAPWKVFNTDYTSQDYPESWMSTSYSAQRMYYKFTKAVPIYKATVKPYRVGGTGTISIATYKYQYSDDASTWTDATSLFTYGAAGGYETKTLGNNGSHLYWAIYIATSNQGAWPGANKMQFYGR